MGNKVSNCATSNLKSYGRICIKIYLTRSYLHTYMAPVAWADYRHPAIIYRFYHFSPCDLGLGTRTGKNGNEMKVGNKPFQYMARRSHKNIMYFIFCNKSNQSSFPCNIITTLCSSGVQQFNYYFIIGRMTSFIVKYRKQGTR